MITAIAACWVGISAALGLAISRGIRLREERDPRPASLTTTTEAEEAA